MIFKDCYIHLEITVMALAPEDIPLPHVLAGDWTRENLTTLARQLGVIQRARKKDVWLLLWTLLLGFSTGSKRTLVGLWETYNQYADRPVASSSFQGWLSASLATFLKHLCGQLIKENTPSLTLHGHLLERFTELIAIDSTVINLHRFLREHYKATAKTGAAAKLHAAINILDANLKSLKLTGQRVGDGTPWKRLGPWVAGRLLLIDLGYYDFNLFSRIDDNGGFFVSRVKRTANPLIVKNLRPCRGRSIEVVGRHLQDVLGDLQRDVVDVVVALEVKKRKYKGKRRKELRRFRMVGLKRPDGGYFLYFTNLPSEEIPADDLASIYTLRWQVELFFASLKGQGRLDQLPSSKKAVVEVLIWSSVLSDLCSRRLYRWLRTLVPQDRHLPPRRFSKVFSRVMADVLDAVLEPEGQRGQRLLRRLLRTAPDPNRHRPDRSLQAIPKPAHEAEVVDLLQHRSTQGVQGKAAA
ncbi:MAG: IS4 family transposase [Myxococcota bacterium]|nr:IS4 family transposase [Myxococcota bacterium]